MRFQATVTGDCPSNRLLSKAVGKDGVTISLTPAGASPDFRSTGELKDGQVVWVTIANSPTWSIEAGEAIKTGQNVKVGAGGVAVVAAEGDGAFGFAGNDAKAGQVVTVIRDYDAGGSGGTVESITSSQITDASNVGKAVLTAADAAAARSAIGAGTSSLKVGTTANDAKAGNWSPATATTSAAGVVKQAAAQTDSAATDVAGLLADFNALLAKLRTAGILAS